MRPEQFRDGNDLKSETSQSLVAKPQKLREKPSVSFHHIHEKAKGPSVRNEMPFLLLPG